MTGYYGYELNWLGITLAALTPMLIGMIWYHPKAFGKAWMNSLGFSEEDLKKGNMAVTMGVTFLMSFTLAYYFAMRYHGHGDESSVIAHATYHGFMTFGYLGMPVLVIQPVVRAPQLVGHFGQCGILVCRCYGLGAGGAPDARS